MNTLVLKFILLLSFYIFSSDACSACYLHFIGEAKKIHSVSDFINCIESLDTINNNNENKNQINNLKSLAKQLVEPDVFFEILKNEQINQQERKFKDAEQIFQTEFFNILKKATKSKNNREGVWKILNKLNQK